LTDDRATDKRRGVEFAGARKGKQVENSYGPGPDISWRMGSTASQRYRRATGHTKDRGPRSMRAIGLKTGGSPMPPMLRGNGYEISGLADGHDLRTVSVCKWPVAAGAFPVKLAA